MNKDILNKNDIIQLVNAFYEKVKKDRLISIYFTEIIQVDWEKHLSVMYDFWDNALFYTGGYYGNPMNIHSAINKKSPFSKKHFSRWIKLFNQTVDELYEGVNANTIKERASNISAIMQIKILKK